jgi:hypothetical protein
MKSRRKLVVAMLHFVFMGGWWENSMIAISLDFSQSSMLG